MPIGNQLAFHRRRLEEAGITRYALKTWFHNENERSVAENDFYNFFIQFDTRMKKEAFDKKK